MTRQLQHKVKCPQCGTEIEAATPFSQWLRDLPAPLDSSVISNQNLDYVWHNYRTPSWLILLEEKRFAGAQNAAQKDTHNIIAQLLELSSGATVKTMRDERAVEFRGYYLIVFEKTTPDDSDWVTVNGTKYDAPKETITRLLTEGRLAVPALTLVEKPKADRLVWSWLKQQQLDRLVPMAAWVSNRIKELYEAEKAKSA